MYEKPLKKSSLPIDPEPVPVDEDAGAADPEHDIYTLAVPGRLQAYPVHGELLGVVQVVQLSLRRGLALHSSQWT